MKKKGSFLSGLVVFVLIIIILGGVGYLGFNIINNANGMAGMDMASDTTSMEKEVTDTQVTDSTSAETSNQDSNTKNNASTVEEEMYKISQINQMMMNKEAISKAYQTVSSALETMTLDPYAVDEEMNSSMSDQMDAESMEGMQNDTATDAQGNTTVNIYTGDVTDQQTMQMTDMGQSYDADKMQQLHSGLYKVSVGMQLLKQLQNDIALQIEAASVDTGSKTEYYMNQYYKTISNKNKLNNALTYINEAVDLININPYVDANGLVYDSERMTALHDSIYTIAQGVVDLNKIDNDLLTQAVDLGSLAQTSYSEALQSQSNYSMSNMNMTTPTSGINLSTLVTFALIAFVVIFLIGLIGSILNLFKSENHSKLTNDVA
ncbi:MAG: hypothetical protein K0R34_2927 [Herbinix sp.]|jgi:hypothetical protein|nr:hypothetical protein [Herbinix sp.]